MISLPVGSSETQWHLSGRKESNQKKKEEKKSIPC